MTINRKQLVLDALDGKDVERIPSGFWFHFLDDEIGSDAFAHPELSQKVLAKQIEYIDSFRPDYVKIMTDGFFHYNHPQVAAAQRVEDLKDLQPLAEDDPWFTRQIEYARQLVQRYGDEIALFYNVFGANTTFRFMQSHWEKGEEKLVSFIREDKETVREAFDVISSDLAKLAKRLITEAHVTGIYFSVQNLLGDGITREIRQRPASLSLFSAIGNHTSPCTAAQPAGIARIAESMAPGIHTGKLDSYLIRSSTR